MRKKSAFTLIELLIVIAILGILMSLLFPAVTSTINAAKKASSKNDVTQIANAVIAYETEYGRLPITNGGSNEVADNWLAALGGSNINSLNSKQRVFLEMTASKKGKSGTNDLGKFVDPWGQTYSIIVDDDYDNTITGAPGSSSLRKRVVVWGLGIPAAGSSKNSAGYRAGTNHVKSWE